MVIVSSQDLVILREVFRKVFNDYEFRDIFRTQGVN